MIDKNPALIVCCYPHLPKQTQGVFVLRTFILALLISISCGASAASMLRAEYPLSLHSALRGPHENANQAFQRYLQRLQITRQSLLTDSAVSVARPFNQVDFSNVPLWTSQIPLEKGFTMIRDLRFLSDPLNANFKRRLSWMYPDDGCFARAGLMRVNLEQLKTNSPAKLFIFGNLKVKTTNSPSGSVSWWYHVVPLVRRGQQLYVLDPAIEILGPLPLKDWIMTMTSDINSIKLSVCKGTAYSPKSSCSNPTNDDSAAVVDQPKYLNAERDRLLELGRKADQELGDYPPWPH